METKWRFESLFPGKLCAFTVSSSGKYHHPAMTAEVLQKVNELLDDMLKFEENWDSCNAKPLTEEVVETVRAVVATLPRLPEIIPTNRQSIELEYIEPDLGCLEFEFCRYGFVNGVFWSVDGTRSERLVYVDAVKKCVEDFYGKGGG